MQSSNSSKYTIAAHCQCSEGPQSYTQLSKRSEGSEGASPQNPGPWPDNNGEKNLELTGVPCLLSVLFYLDFRQSREQTLVITGHAVHRKAISSSLSLCLLMPAGPRLSSIHVTAHCGPNELPEAQAEYLMRLLSVNGYCDQRRVPVHLAEGLHSSCPCCWGF